MRAHLVSKTASRTAILTLATLMSCFGLPPSRSRLHAAEATVSGGIANAEQAEASPAGRLHRTELDEYVARPDDAFAWEVIKRRTSPLGSELVIDMKSQRWRTPGEVDRTLWQHWITVAIPAKAKSHVALLFISGSDNGKEPPEGNDDRIRQIAMAAGAVVAEVKMIPNQPLVLNGDGQQRWEDSIIACSWDLCLKTGDRQWPAQLPMTKAAVRAMDAVQAALAAENGAPRVSRFVVAGGSKRGWTTWLTAAVDSRVVAIAPIVIDMLNIQESMENHHAVYGFWSPALDDYVEFGLPEKFGDPEYESLIKLVDPYSYRERLAMPKCIINSTGDEFFTPDSSRFYFDELVGEKHLAYFPNGGHSLEGTKAVETLTAFFASIVHDRPRPQVEWKLTADGAWQVTAEPAPTRATLWQATNPEARDFRMPVIGKAFTSVELQPSAPGVYEASAQPPAEGFTAYFVQLEFDVGAPTPLLLSTPVQVTPDVRPFEPAEQAGN